MSDLTASLEAILFVAEEPVPVSELAEVTEADADTVREALDHLALRLSESGSGLVLRESGPGWRLYTRPDLHHLLERYATTARAGRLSKAALETLAVVAYRQPVSRAQVSEIRGVDSEHALRTLERRGLADIVGTAPGAGQALLYGTTDLFLEKLGLRDLQELPPLADHVPPASVVEDLEQPMRPEDPIQRLQKLIAHAGLDSRRGAEELIRAGRVKVDGEPAHLGQKIDVTTEKVTVDGIPLPVLPGLVYYLLYKPPGVVSTADDPQGRTTVVDLVPADTRVYPVGRLDADSEGLLVLTNDGDLTFHLTHPSRGVTKTYVARVAGLPRPSALARLTDGIELEDGPAAARSARLLDALGDEALIELVMGEGRNREVRRMFEAIGHPVSRLVRIAVGPLRDRDLAPGTWRSLSLDEVRRLYAAGEMG